MATRDGAKYQERNERQGDRAPDRAEVLGHEAANAPDEGEQSLSVNDEATEAEVEGHLIGTNPYLMEKQAHAKQQDFHAEAALQRMANEASGGRGMIDRVKDRFRGNTG
jgi:hypothetical protein